MTRRVLLVVGFGFFPSNISRRRRNAKDILPFYDYGLSGGDSQNWWGQSNFVCCNWKTFLHSQALTLHLHLLVTEPSDETFTIFDSVVGYAGNQDADWVGMTCNRVTDSVADWVTDSVADWVNDSIVDWVTDSVADWVTDSGADWVTDSVADWVGMRCNW